MSDTEQIAVATYDFKQAAKECHEAMERVDEGYARVLELLELQERKEVWHEIV